MKAKTATKAPRPRSLKRVVWPLRLHHDHEWLLRTLGANIKAMRLKVGVSMGVMAKLSGVSKGNCSKIERGSNITALGLYRLCWSLGVHPREVLPEYRPNDQAQRPHDELL